MSELRVENNTPRLLEKGESPPPTTTDIDQLPPEVPQRYWTPDKAQHVVARLCHAGSKFYGPSVKAAEWELELIGDPAAAVLNDWLPLRVGEGGDRTANLLALGAVVAILVVLRLPDILEVHGVEFPWAKRQRELSGAPAPAARREEPRQEQPAAPPTMSVVDGGRGAFDEQLVGMTGATAAAAAGDDEKKREAIYGEQLIGGGSKFATMHDIEDQPA